MRFKEFLCGAIVGEDAPLGRPALEASADEHLQHHSLRVGLDDGMPFRRCIDRVLRTGEQARALARRSMRPKRSATAKTTFVKLQLLAGEGIVVRHEVGRGSRLAIRAPIASTIGVRASTGSETGREGGQVVAIVDDEPLLVELAEEMVVRLGYVALAFHSGGDALAAFDDPALRVDLLLTDEMMPLLSGSELVAAIRAKGWDIPVIVMSGNVTMALEQRARANGVCALLRKPLSHATLTAALARCLRPREK